MADSNKVALRLEDLIIGFPGRVLLPPVTLQVEKGELISVIGQNGIGKSTLLKTLAGVTPRIGGKIFIGLKDIAELERREFATAIGYISTEKVDAPNMRISDLVSIGRFSYTNWMGTLTDEDFAMIQKSLIMVGLAGMADRFVNELSDGERQRAMIARVLAQDTCLLVLDEPTAFLDIRNRYEIIHLLHDLTRSNHKSIIMSSHDLQSAIGESDRIWLLTAEGIIDGAPEDLVLNGAFDNMFLQSNIKFRKSDGNFYPAREEKGYATVTGEGLEKQWASKALRRMGFRVRDKEAGADLTILCPDGNNQWIVTLRETTYACKSIYELAKFVRDMN
ncbi:MAG: ABC transporter ATP-binding protein [Bacteroidales bacterium]|nr:ABC transporter ATP-binding protein [Bacteroidales bacterium]